MFLVPGRNRNLRFLYLANLAPLAADGELPAVREKATPGLDVDDARVD
jgi:hypothetical protein